MKNTADVVIIGAGIIGPSTSYYLAKNGVKNVVILDTYSAGGMATNASAAMIMHQTGVEETTKLAKLSINKYKNFKEEVGADIEFKRNGSIIYSTTNLGKDLLQKQAVMQNRCDVLTKIIDSSFIEKKSKGLISGNGLKSGIYAPEDAYINASFAVNAYLSRAKEKGLRIQEQTKVTKIVIDKNKVSAVETEKGERIYTDTVINCAGVYAEDIASTIGIKIPIKASKKCLGIIKNAEYKYFPIMEDYDSGWYFRPHSKGILVGFGMGKWIEDDHREEFPKFELQKMKELRSYLKHLAPQLMPAELLSGWAGYRPMIDPQYKDALPIIGAVDGIKGYFNNCGYGEFGITLAPIGGELISQIIMNQPNSVDIKPFLLSRFNN